MIRDEKWLGFYLALAEGKLFLPNLKSIAIQTGDLMTYNPDTVSSDYRALKSSNSIAPFSRTYSPTARCPRRRYLQTVIFSILANTFTPPCQVDRNLQPSPIPMPVGDFWFRTLPSERYVDW
jgi:hypothetical protein